MGGYKLLATGTTDLGHFAKNYGDYKVCRWTVSRLSWRRTAQTATWTSTPWSATWPASPENKQVINLGMMYGMGVNKLADQLDVSVDEARALTQQYHKRVPFVKGLMKSVQKKLEDPRSSGSVRSLRGRKCRFDLWEPDAFEMHKALPKKPSRPTSQRPDYDGPTPTKP